jgi:hypothetical protein
MRELVGLKAAELVVEGCGRLKGRRMRGVKGGLEDVKREAVESRAAVWRELPPRRSDATEERR